MKIEVIGIRPAEKLHEVMISEEECHHTVARGNYYAIRSMLPELAGGTAEPNALDKEFSSADTVIDLQGTIDLLARHRLHVDQIATPNGVELFEAAAAA